MGHLAVASCSVRSALRSMAKNLVPCVEEYVQNTSRMLEVSLLTVTACSINKDILTQSALLLQV